MNLVFHISEDVSEIELKHCAFSKTSVKAPRICQISAVSDLFNVNLVFHTLRMVPKNHLLTVTLKAQTFLGFIFGR